MTTFFRLLKDTEKDSALRSAVAAYRAGNPDTDRTFTVEPVEFRKVPNTPFAYWVDDEIRDLFVTLPPFESEGRTVRVGLQTGDDFRFVRAWWEVDADRRLDPVEGGAPDWRDDIEAFQQWCRNRTYQGKYWAPFAKGGEYSPYYSDIHLVVNWKNEGEEMKAYSGSVIRNPDYYFRPGVTWSYRTHRLCGQVLPAGIVISVRGSGAYAPTDYLPVFLGLTNAATTDALVKIQMGRDGHPQFDQGDLGTLPIPRLAPVQESQLRSNSEELYVLVQAAHGSDETSRIFNFRQCGEHLDAQRLRALQRDVEKLVAESYGLRDDEAGDATFPGLQSLKSGHDVLSIAVGMAFGRWESGTRSPVSLDRSHDIFAPFNVAPGPASENWSQKTQVNADSSSPPSRVNGAPESKSLALLERNKSSQMDLSSNVVSYLDTPGFKTVLEQYRLDIPSDPTYFDTLLNDPNKFFAFHLTMYSKSRRKAPIYWPLSTKSGGYTIWLYYPRLDDSTLFSAYQLARDKYELLEKERLELEAKPQADRTKQDQRRFDEVVRDSGEVRELADELLRITKLPYKPDRDDGVPICAAPLYGLFRHAAWSRYLEGVWTQLARGDFDWAHLAFAIWPDRVREKARADKSIAIAHGLETGE